MKSYIISGILLAGVAHAQQTAWGQCGGMGWTGQTSCVSGFYCSYGNPWYSQCLPGSGPTSVPQTTAKPTTTLKTTTKAPTPTANGKTQYIGVNIAGFDFGCTTDGTCDTTKTYPPLSSLGGDDGLGQMQHFVRDDHMNVFRLPVGWQYLQSSPGAALNSANFGKYDQLMQACLSTGATCIIDIHNYARWNGQIIGQGGPTDAQFANLWSQLATKYASNSKIMFGLMNEPHEVDINKWAVSLQAAVNAIRAAGAKSQLILLPGNNYASAGSFLSGSAAALCTVKDSDGTTSKLIFDVHKYLDVDNSGTHAECTTNNVDVFNQLASWLRSNGRKAILTETGGGNTSSCLTNLCQQVAAINAASDVLIGIVGWSAGNFGTTYVLTEVPVNNGGTWTDQLLMKACLAR